MSLSIPSVGIEERGRIGFTINRFDHPVNVPGGGWFSAAQNANATDFRQITTSPHSAYNFAWSPDGKWIAYSLQIYTNLPDFMVNPPPMDSLADFLKATAEFYKNPQVTLQSMQQMQIMPQLCIVNADGTQNREFEGVYASQFVWSPDGTQLALITNTNSLELIDVIGENRRSVMTVDRQTYLGGFSPDGAQLLVADKQLHILKLDGSKRKDLRVRTAPNIYPTWSPDGKQIAFIGYKGDKIALYVINADGSNLHNLASIDTFEDVGVSWSPNSQEIAYVSFPPNNDDFIEHEALWVVAADGQSKPRKLAEIYGEDVNRDEMNVSEPAWSPDGTRIAFLALHDPDNLSHDIYLINPDGSDMRRVTDDGELKNNLAWQPHLVVN